MLLLCKEDIKARIYWLANNIPGYAEYELQNFCDKYGVEYVADALRELMPTINKRIEEHKAEKARVQREIIEIRKELAEKR